jgi:hypothetical protein
MQNLVLAGLGQDFCRQRQAIATGRAAAGAHGQLFHAPAAVVGSAANFAVANTMAKADVHDPNPNENDLHLIVDENGCQQPQSPFINVLKNKRMAWNPVTTDQA